ncbi:aminotransferase DegT [Thiomicrospira aerophila AL3]|uniref:Aminotransferase DegT n=1 Tax=Thiomicrospira aerophila AL3 TaxID=717772 RepID=W0DT25_9GAMM|nr:LegC family aminotransferase [Thiomicrospira aerophila]AHF01597.1 aminotransferase DegT [Thiomicrospira aerophila AL3]
MSNQQAWLSMMAFIRQHYQQAEGLIPLHAPCFDEAEKRLVVDCIDSTFVSSVGQYVTEFEQQITDFTGAKHAVAVVNGTMGLHLALKVIGLQANDLVITQSLTFVATPNAIKMHQADPVFVDVERETLGLCPESLNHFLTEQTIQQNGECVHRQTDRVIRACVPMHTLGFPARIDAILEICNRHNIALVEDAAESLGSFYQGQHTGRFGQVGVFSFNGNKVITTGGGGMLITNNAELARHAKHLSTTAKVPHAWLFEHDEPAYNLRMPNINAALGVAQMQKLPAFLTEKRALAQAYQQQSGLVVLNEPTNTQSNYWLNALLCESEAERNAFLEFSNRQHIQTRPLWTPMHQLAIYVDCLRTDMTNTDWLAARVVNVPSGVRCDG